MREGRRRRVRLNLQQRQQRTTTTTRPRPTHTPNPASRSRRLARAWPTKEKKTETTAGGKLRAGEGVGRAIRGDNGGETKGQRKGCSFSLALTEQGGGGGRGEGNGGEVQAIQCEEREPKQPANKKSKLAVNPKHAMQYLYLQLTQRGKGVGGRAGGGGGS